MALDVEASDVVRIVLQFCKENGLSQSFNALAAETQTSLNTVDSIEGFVADVTNGRWDLVLPQVTTMRLSKRKLEDLYEQVAVETMESDELDAAKSLLRESVVLSQLRQEQPERHNRLERLLERAAAGKLDEKTAYPNGSSREKRRIAVAKALQPELTTAPPSRLLALLGQALKWQKQNGLLQPGDNFDVFRGEIRTIMDEEESCPTELHKTIKMGKRNHAEAVCGSPDGQSLAVGSKDGFVEIYDWNSGKLRMDLKYQREGLFLMHDDAVLSLDFSSDGDMLVSASQDGKIKVWRVDTGVCLRKFDRVHGNGVTSVKFSSDGSHVLSASFDGTTKIHGLKSGKTLKEMRGHTSFVNDARYFGESQKVVSASTDGYVKTWDAKTGEELASFCPPQPASAKKTGAKCPIANVCVLQSEPATFLVCPRNSDSMHVMSVSGDLIRTFTQDDLGESNSFVSACVSPKGDFIYGLGSNGTLQCFSQTSGKREHTLPTLDSDALGLCHHARQNIVATFSKQGGVKLWKP